MTAVLVCLSSFIFIFTKSCIQATHRQQNAFKVNILHSHVYRETSMCVCASRNSLLENMIVAFRSFFQLTTNTLLSPQLLSSCLLLSFCLFFSTTMIRFPHLPVHSKALFFVPLQLPSRVTFDDGVWTRLDAAYDEGEIVFSLHQCSQSPLNAMKGYAVMQRGWIQIHIWYSAKHNVEFFTKIFVK